MILILPDSSIKAERLHSHSSWVCRGVLLKTTLVSVQSAALQAGRQ